MDVYANSTLVHVNVYKCKQLRVQVYKQVHNQWWYRYTLMYTSLQ